MAFILRVLFLRILFIHEQKCLADPARGSAKHQSQVAFIFASWRLCVRSIARRNRSADSIAGHRTMALTLAIVATIARRIGWLAPRVGIDSANFDAQASDPYTNAQRKRAIGTPSEFQPVRESGLEAQRTQRPEGITQWRQDAE